jgi:hypothetical protein
MNTNDAGVALIELAEDDLFSAVRHGALFHSAFKGKAYKLQERGTQEFLTGSSSMKA